MKQRQWLMILAGALLAAGVLGSCAREARREAPGERISAAVKPGRFSKEEVDMAFRVLRKATGEGKVPGAVGAIVTPEGVVDCRAYGYRCLEPERLPMERNTVFDLASLTKMVATTTSLCILLERGQLRLDDPVHRYLPEFDRRDKRGIQVRHLVTHTSGLAAWKPLFRTLEGREAFLQAIADSELEARPGEKHQYSDLGFITLGLVIEKASGQGLDAFATENIYRPLGMLETGFRPAPESRNWCAATEACPWRQRIIWGEVHDENAFAMGGVAGHAGVFSTADDLVRFCQMILRGGELDGVRILKPETIAQFNRSQTNIAGANQGLGWRIKDPEDSVAGPLFSPNSFGHTGFTGTSIWFDPERQVASILLTNRVHPSRENQHINPLRKDFNTAVIEAYEG